MTVNTVFVIFTLRFLNEQVNEHRVLQQQGPVSVRSGAQLRIRAALQETSVNFVL